MCQKTIIAGSGENGALRHRLRRFRLMLPPAGNVLAVAAGGMIGAVLRVWLVIAFPNPSGGFPLTTFLENVVGAFLLGLLLVLLLERWRPIRPIQPLLCTGILGSFTTFSNFSVEWVMLAASERPWLGLAYPVASMAAGLTAALLGVSLARRWPPFVKQKGKS
jgi:fluoride exporter